jgi:LmbE family N-acetylglucosaminyl deacetylase
VKLFVSPHNDDEVLFGAFTLMTERPYVVIVYDSYVQHERGLKGCDWSSRRRETIAACAVLGIPSAHVFFLGFPDSKVDTPEAIANRLAALPVLTGFGTSEFETVYAPMGYAPKGNQHHNKVNLACQLTFQTSGQLKYYHTYKAEGKVTSGVRVPVPAEIQGITPAVELKLRALLKYKSQLGLWSTQDHFLREQYEYMEA